MCSGVYSVATILPDPCILSSSTKPTSKSFVKILLQTCRNAREIKQIHARLVVTGHLSSRSTATKLIESYVSMYEIDYAWSIFVSMQHVTIFMYNILIRGFNLVISPYKSLLLFREILLGDLIPDSHTYTFILKSCSILNTLAVGKQVHSHIIKGGISLNTHICSSLIHMYGHCYSIDSARQLFVKITHRNTLIENAMISCCFHCGQVDHARKLFDSMISKDVATWSAMVTGYTRNNLYKEALTLFHDMIIHGVQPNESVIVSALAACGSSGRLDQGRWIHAYLNKNIRDETSVVLGTALIDMYAKCGSIDNSYEVFINMSRRDVVTWAAMISGFGMYGKATKCFELFSQMENAGDRPNATVFVAILSACSHVGLVDEGWFYFNRMVNHYKIEPCVEHYGCMVDLLGRAGYLSEAEELTTSMPEEPNSVILGSLLSACRIHKDLRRGERVFRQLISLEPDSGDRFKLVGHLFAAAGKLEDAIKVKRIIKERELETTRGSSIIELDGMIHEFVVGEIGHGSKAREIRKMLEDIHGRLRKNGVLPMREEVLLDIEEDDKEESLKWHSERIAIAFGLLSTKGKTPLRVFKNLRVCTDCHSVIKFISKEYDREIIMRDRQRFHVFKHGKCSCKDYW